MDGNLTLKIDILERPYNLKVREQDREIFCQASVIINNLVQRYETKLTAFKDKQDLLAMALLESVVSALKNKRKEEESELEKRVDERLIRLDELLSSVLDKTK